MHDHSMGDRKTSLNVGVQLEKKINVFPAFFFANAMVMGVLISHYICAYWGEFPKIFSHCDALKNLL